MSEKTNKYEEQLDNLISKGDSLYMAIQYEYHGRKFIKFAEKTFGQEKAKEIIDNIPNFKTEYQSWYSESLALIKQVLPDRVKDLLSYYEYPRARKHITFENYMIRDHLQGLRVGDTPKLSCRRIGRNS